MSSLQVVPVEVSSLVRQSLDGTQSEVSLSDGENLKPELLSPGLCANVVLKVSGSNITVYTSRLRRYVRKYRSNCEQDTATL